MSLQTRVTDETGVSVSIEKIDANRVTVTAGPTEAVKAYNGIGVNLKSFTATLGANDTLGSSAMKTATFDLSTPQGRVAYNDFLSTGQMPTSSRAGVTDIRTTEKLTYDSASKVGIKIGSFDLSQEITSNSGSVVRITNEDGSYTRVANFQYGENAPLTVNQSFDAAGNEQIEDRTFTYTVVLDETTASKISDDFTVDPGSRFESGQTVTIGFSPDQAQTFLEKYQSGAQNYPGNKIAALNHDDLTPEQLLVGLAKSPTLGSHHGVVATFFTATQLSSQDLRDPAKFEATVTHK